MCKWDVFTICDSDGIYSFKEFKFEFSLLFSVFFFSVLFFFKENIKKNKKTLNILCVWKQLWKFALTSRECVLFDWIQQFYTVCKF